MSRILVTNDDGVHSDGIDALAEALAALGEVTIVAPVQEASAIGHALTLRHPLRLERLRPSVYTVDGTPTDCVNVAIAHVLHGKPDLIVSGINKGWNLGDDVTYSGTVAGALEGALLGIASLAVSAQNKDNQFEFGSAARAAATVAEAVLERGMPRFTFLNINVPFGPYRGFRATVQARRNHVTVVSRRVDPRHRAYFWIEEGENEWEAHDRSDYEAVRDGYVSVTPLEPDMTAHEALRYVEGLPLVSPVEVR
ncbi:MAG: 5'/3'-nucleotidase SurE [Acidobacteria bacterium RIFCSPLOWO2_02_FULL_68_18]|nr:MAG: 5'/3'-nucleotidase SurE [Acidobacteria bacterium RIFCSPLOWO2_02_FULL_68_18]OFW49121.1 MAG: 5'/3'-nucleotidase SurE [Acidobacteria bacterium RIFCSPLOWO2_12_FULL_68_19]